MKELRFAILGTGFWSRYQLAGWRELNGARCVALYNRTRAKAEKLAAEFGVPAVYDDAEELLQREKPDFIDIITDVDTHSRFVHLASAYQTPVICQKPMAPSIAEAEKMIAACRAENVPFSVHENWRWQRPIRELKKVLDSGVIGRVFRARIDYGNSFPVFDNQPFLKTVEQFIIADMGSHVLDVARFLFGEPARLYCQTHQIHRDIVGEDAASVMMRMQAGATVTCNLSYASRVEHDCFPQTFALVEGEEGSVELAPDYWLRVTTEKGTETRRCPPPDYTWADPRYALVHASIVECHANLLHALQTGTAPETSAEDNLKTLRLVQAAYDSARHLSAVETF
ncbi:MAG TPA: Gfo/Idh/MocA family oxidoreductase [Methylomirabilota bacterium]|nr:Gfo/Idh/MocA family oxidoreductase [Methylomirabilota bacterium]